MNNVIAVELPLWSDLRSRIEPSDFLDCYSIESDLSPRRAADIITDFPGWARFLLLIRRIVTTPFGLSNDGPAALDKIGIFPVEAENNQELIAGFNDKHLNFRVSVMSKDGHVFLATWVRPHNVGGRVYLGAIIPFHVAISRNALTRVSYKSAL